jgi:predicted enzyme related to lactoylglutathione lyase
MTDRKLIPGKFRWFELVAKDAKKAQAFYGEVLGWRVEGFPMGAFTYEMIYAGDTMIGGYAPPKTDQPSHWIAYVTVDDVDAAAKTAVENGGKIVLAPADIPTVGRSARIADPQGAELCLFRSADGDPPDVENTPAGQFFWNELHTTDTASALSFYEKLIGYTHETMDMGPAGQYHVLSRGGVGRGGVTSHLSPGNRPHWLPYVVSDDVDATCARAKRAGGAVQFGPEDIPGVGRAAVLRDPTGAVFSVMKPLPRMKPGAT